MLLKKVRYGYLAVADSRRREWRFAWTGREWELANPYVSLSFKQRKFPTLKQAYHAALAYEKESNDQT